MIDAAHGYDRAFVDIVNVLELGTVSHVLFHDANDPEVGAAISGAVERGDLICNQTLGWPDLSIYKIPGVNGVSGWRSEGLLCYTGSSTQDAFALRQSLIMASVTEARLGNRFSSIVI